MVRRSHHIGADFGDERFRNRTAWSPRASPPDSAAVAKSSSGGDFSGFEGDVVAECFELSDEAFGEAVGVLSVK